MEVRNRFKGLDLIDSMPDILWTEVRDIVQETGIKTIPMEKKCKKAKWLSGEALQIAVKEELPRSVGAQYATGDQWRNNSRKNEGMEPKQKQSAVVDVTGDRSKV